MAESCVTPDPSAARPLRIVSYNIHACVGVDGRWDPDRIAQVLTELDPDIVGIQEFETHYRDASGREVIRHLAEAMGCAHVLGTTTPRHAGEYGNLLLTRLPVRSERRIDLSVPGREPRGALDVRLEAAGRPLRVVVTHFGLQIGERSTQAARLVEALGDDRQSWLVVLGDVNEWLPFGPSLRRLNRRLGASRSVRSFPSWRPVLPLDRIWVQPARSLLEVRAVRTPATELASDHLPVLALAGPPA